MSAPDAIQIGSCEIVTGDQEPSGLGAWRFQRHENWSNDSPEGIYTFVGDFAATCALVAEIFGPGAVLVLLP